MNKRMYPRTEVLRQNIDVTITTKDGNTYDGNIKDLSRIGMSFYTYESLIGEIVVSFTYKGTPMTFEMEILRSKMSIFGTQYSGRFKGVPSVLKSLLPKPIMVQKQLVMI